MSFTPPPSIPLYQQQYQQGCQLVQQGMTAEAAGQLLPASQCLEQGAQWLDASVATARQWGMPIWDVAFFSCAYAHFNAARIQAQLGQWQAAPPHLGQALAALNAAIQVNPRVFYYHSAAGVVLLAQGNPAEANRAFNAALGLNPNDPYSQYMLAMLHAAQGNTAAATALYSAAQSTVPGLPAVQQMLPTAPSGPAAAAPGAGPQPRWLDVLTKLGTIADAVNKIGGAVNTVNGLMGGFNPGAGTGWNQTAGWNPGMGWPQGMGHW